MELSSGLGKEALIARADPVCHQQLSALALESKQMWGYPLEWILAWADDLRVTAEDINNNRTVVASLGGESLGFYMLKNSRQKLWLEHLWVAPRVCRKGMGSKLFAHASAKRVGERHTMMYGCERIHPILTFNLAPKTHSQVTDSETVKSKVSI